MSDTYAVPKNIMVRNMRRALQVGLSKPNIPTPQIRHPRDLVPVRDALLAELPRMVAEDTVTGEQQQDYIKNLSVPVESVEMYFGTPDFADLFQEMLEDLGPDDKSLLTRDIVRAKGDHGTMLFAFDDRHVPSLAVEYLHGTYNSEDTNVVIRYTPLAWGLLGWHYDPYAQNAQSPTGFGLVKFTSMHMKRRFHDEFSDLDDLSTNPDDPHDLYPGTEGSSATIQLCLMAWIMLNSGPRPLVNVSKQPALEGLPPAVKKTYPKHYKHETVHVINLHAPMRKQMRDVTEARRVLQHRFVVRGHWRKQKVGTGRLETKLTYIAPYVKGPDGAPFVAREKVFKW